MVALREQEAGRGQKPQLCSGQAGRLGPVPVFMSPARGPSQEGSHSKAQSQVGRASSVGRCQVTPVLWEEPWGPTGEAVIHPSFIQLFNDSSLCWATLLEGRRQVGLELRPRSWGLVFPDRCPPLGGKSERHTATP